MGRLSSLDFDADLEYQETAAGILVPVRLIHGDRSVELTARLDTGAADCLFDRFYAEMLELPKFRGGEALSDSHGLVCRLRARDYH